MDYTLFIIPAVTSVVSAFSAWSSYRSARAAERAVERLEAHDIPRVSAEPDLALHGILISNIGSMPVTVTEVGHIIDGRRDPYVLTGYRDGSGMVNCVAHTLAPGGCYTIQGFDMGDGDATYVRLATGNVFLFDKLANLISTVNPLSSR